MKLSLLTAITATALTTIASQPPDVVVYVAGRETPPSAVEQGARATVTRMYRQVGVRIAWRDGEPRPGAAGSARLAIRIRYGAVVRGAHTLASAAPFGTGPHAVTVDYGRIRGVAGRLTREQAILAHVLAHEIGHILQGTDWHADTGVMKANWRPADYDNMQRGPLAFTAEDVRLISRGLAAAAAAE